jgi:hypothetical protein
VPVGNREHEPRKQGRGLHLIGRVFGRTTNSPVRADGTMMHALADG